MSNETNATIDEIMKAAADSVRSEIAHNNMPSSLRAGICERKGAALRHAITASLAAKDVAMAIMEAESAAMADALKQIAETVGLGVGHTAAEIVAAVKAQLAEPEPAAWRIQQGARVYIISNAEFVRSSFDAASMTPLYEKPQPAAGTAKPAPGEWIEWAGGECPIADGVQHQCKFRDGSLSEICDDASSWSWRQSGEDYDIVAYKVLA